ncbi:hypothetical protein AB0M28_05955 [Streptomyces sp. NPDC051940]|uniref:hypothetical protein n=1 Tax=Streptomyces sp. NPDC051940 TaxID=3155675 RepID=UPI00342778E1
MPKSYTTMWPQDVCKRLRRGGYEGRVLEVLFGGPHHGMPRFGKAVKPGDVVYPVSLIRGNLHVIGRVEVVRVAEYDDYPAGSRTPGLDDEEFATIQRWPELVFNCVSEALIGRNGTPINLGSTLPADALTRMTYLYRRGGERPLRHVVDGRLTHYEGIRGVYELTPASADDLRRAVESPQPTPAGAGTP